MGPVDREREHGVLRHRYPGDTREARRGLPRICDAGVDPPLSTLSLVHRRAGAAADRKPLWIADGARSLLLGRSRLVPARTAHLPLGLGLPRYLQRRSSAGARQPVAGA